MPISLAQISKKKSYHNLRLHGPGYQALIMVNNSQGHGIYAPDALLTHDMNYNPGGAQPRLQDGWFFNTSRSHSKWTFPQITHNSRTNLKEWSKFSLNEGSSDQDWRCSARSPVMILMQLIAVPNAFLICNLISRSRSLLCMKQSRLLVISALCSPNIIEFFWGAMKRYLHVHCDYTFLGFQKKIFQMPCIQLMCLPFGSGSIGWYAGWMCTEKGRAPRRLRYR